MTTFGRKLIDNGQRLIVDHADMAPTGFPRADFLYGNFIDRPARIIGHVVVAIGKMALHANGES